MNIICPDCKRGIAPASPRVVYNGQAVCGDCSYYRDTGKYNPRMKNEAERETGRHT